MWEWFSWCLWNRSHTIIDKHPANLPESTDNCPVT